MPLKVTSANDERRDPYSDDYKLYPRGISNTVLNYRRLGLDFGISSQGDPAHIYLRGITH